MKTNNEEYIYIYNFTQANFYISKGLKIYKIGKHRFTKEIFFVFKRNDTREVYKEWLREGQALKKNNV